MPNPSSESVVTLAAWLAIVGGLIGVAAYVVKNVRENSLHGADHVADANAQLTKFREMNAQGELSDEEFRTIKTRLQQQLMDDLNDSAGGA